MSLSSHFQFWITCPQGTQGLVKQEVETITEQTASDWHKGVSFSGALVDGYRYCLWSRIANRVIVSLAEVSDVTTDALQALVQSIDWDEHLRPTGTLKVNFTGYLPEIRDTRFGAQKVKDWIVDQFRDRHGVRPSFDRDADIEIFVQIAKKKMFVGLDITGESLHKRHYRQATGPAPIKENLAAALLLASHWPEKARHGETFIDLMCGSGTIMAEAAMIAADCAPGLGRRQFGFEKWLQHDTNSWRNLLTEARQRHTAGAENMPSVLGYDADGGVVAAANATLERLALHKHARCYQKALEDWTLPTHWTLKPGLWVSNPPYGERLGHKPELLRTYRRIGAILKEQLPDWDAAMLTSDETLAREIGLRPNHKRQFYNGRIGVNLYHFSGAERGDNVQDDGLTEQLTYFRNRLDKNLKRLRKWLNKDSIEAFRVYDADIPEFAIAVDKYGDYLHVQEYAPPKSVPEHKAQRRLMNAVDVLAECFNIPVANIAIKRRERQKGAKQYERKADSRQHLEVVEYGVRLKVNLFDYLDTGLFLDHRNMRHWVQQNSQDKAVLNLFCYTGAFSAHAFVGGAKSVTSVDLSKTYLAWGKDNLVLNNGRPGKGFEFVHADCMKWLQEAKGVYDLIVLDPPTFSNSARMKDTLDVQRDHEFLVNECMRLLSNEGVLIFSNNYQRFKIADSLQQKYRIKDITKRSVPDDFARKAPHICFEIRHQS
jgi:23S rRNA (guanine2445-N2)-methyltransferase / 23S rRNA (guanine2069-N7)-methyltransferase